MVLAQKGALGTKGDQALMMKNDEKSRLTCRSDFELNLLVISLPFSLRSYYPLTLFFFLFFSVWQRSVNIVSFAENFFKIKSHVPAKDTRKTLTNKGVAF